ncbi:polysaccharide biosynthesis/export family protein [Desulfobulbus rhabdoformis]|uniref:polysaccharide biosynthesis/export family protein n=1 Tax=Desulfobulbus rhabdoformis TaxID=34032 RepID=UPI0019644E0D|nr:polysaccharide biosynthesis/export family protein [Desulfobulbus rhabdoformis]MBM9613660.1 polysaccharide biosynthesis/export family protein [Desulfobulbus rhabdoformis]
MKIRYHLSITVALVFILPFLVHAATQPPNYPDASPPAGNKQISFNKSGMAPYGAELFQGKFAQGYFDGRNDDYLIMPGDRVRLQLWGAQTYDGILEVDARGNLFLPEIGPVRVERLAHAKLENAIREKVRSVFTKNVEVYVNLLKPQPVAVFVSGFVAQPGRYAGGPTDSVLYFLDLAGGVDPDRGSYRDIRVLRRGKTIAQIDLYPFLREGLLPPVRLEDGDVLLVEERGPSIAVEGQVRHAASFEFQGTELLNGNKLLAMVNPENNASHVSVVGTRGGAPYNVYLPLDQFAKLPLEDGDLVRFHADIPGNTIMVAASGAIVGASRYPVDKNTRLQTLLLQIAVEPKLANLDGIHLRRRSVAFQQKKALHEALQRLQQSSLTATSSSVDEANIRVHEAELIAKFVEKAKQIEPDGTVVVRQGDKVADIHLENGDEIIIPPKSDVVLISGEVLIPQAVIWSSEFDVDDYVAGAGGFSDRADKNRLLVVKPNGAVLLAQNTDIKAGDRILVLPRFDSKNMQVFKDISQILYQIAVAAKVAIDM